MQPPPRFCRSLSGLAILFGTGWLTLACSDSVSPPSGTPQETTDASPDAREPDALQIPADASIRLLVRSRSFPPHRTACSGQEQLFEYDLTTHHLTSKRCILHVLDAGTDDQEEISFEESARILDDGADSALRAALGRVIHPPRVRSTDCPLYLLTVTAAGTSRVFRSECEAGDEAAENLWPLDDAFRAALDGG